MPECDVVGIVTAPEIFKISYRPQGVRNVLHANFRPAAIAHGIPIDVMNSGMKNPELIALIKSWQPDFMLVIGWYHIVPKEILEIAPVGGLHASLLPAYRGAAPLVWAMIHGEVKTGITFFLFDDGVDTGPIIGQSAVDILERDDIRTLYARIEEHGLLLLERYLPKIGKGEIKVRPQPGNSSNVYPSRSPEDGEIDWHWPAKQIYDFVRAQTRPYPGAFTTAFGKHVKIWKARVLTRSEAKVPNIAQPGKLLFPADRECLLITCGDRTAIAIEEAEVDGSTLTADALARWAQKEAESRPERAC